MDSSVPTDIAAETSLPPAEASTGKKKAFDLRRGAVWILFLTSGVCALIYEVLWCRHLGLIFGNTVQSLSAVLTAFMGGLALGSFVGGRFCEKLKRPLLAYGIIELLIGAYCAVLPFLFSEKSPIIPFYQSLYGETGSGSLVVMRFVISFILLLIPTTLMGATLPILSQFMVRSKKTLGRTAGALYAVNTFGAVVGAASTGFILLPWLGKESTNWVAVAMNVLLGVMAIALGLKPQPVETEAPSESAAPATPGSDPANAVADPVSPKALRVAIIAFGVTGFAAMATQIGWTRAISLGTGSSTYAFSLIVSVFIMGLGFGGVWGSRQALRTADPVGLLGKVLLAIGAFSMALTVLLGYSPWIFFFLLAWTRESGHGVLLLLQAVGIAMLIIIPTFLMGATMPLTMQVASRGSDSAGRTVGTLYAVNTVGSILGSFLGGLVLLPLVQIRGTLMLMALLYALPGLVLFALSVSRKERRSTIEMGVLTALLLVVLAISQPWDPATMSSGLYLLRDSEALRAARENRFLDALKSITSDRETLYYKEGTSATVAVTKIGPLFSLSVGGKPDATNNADMSTQVGLAMIPLVIHPTGAEEVLVIGLGSGVSAGCALAPESVKRVDIVEMSPEVVEASVYFQNVNGLKYSEKPVWIDTPRVETIINDGRNHLLLTSRKYDVIASEPSNPWLAGVGNLFTREAFDLARRHLKPGGLMCQWLHGYALSPRDFNSILRTFGEVFPHMQMWCVNRSDYLLIGAETPLRVPLKQIRERLAMPGIEKHLRMVSLHTEAELLACFMSSDEMLDQISSFGVMHTDDNMLLEFSAPRSLYLPDPFRTSILIFDPEAIVDPSALPPDAAVDFLNRLDRSVAAREHWRASIELSGPVSDHLDAVELLVPNQLWARGRLSPAEENAGGPQPISEGVKVWQLIDGGRGEEAEAAINALAAKSPAEVAFMRAAIALSKNDMPAARALVAEGKRLGGNEGMAQELEAMLAWNSNRRSEALEMLAASDNPRHLTVRARLLRTVDPNEALKSLEASINILPTAPALQLASTIQIEIADQLKTRNVPKENLAAMYGQAYVSMRRAAAAQPANIDICLGFAGACRKLARNVGLRNERKLAILRQARRATREALIREPENVVAWLNLCHTFRELIEADAPMAATYRQEAVHALTKAKEFDRAGTFKKVADDLEQKLK